MSLFSSGCKSTVLSAESFEKADAPILTAPPTSALSKLVHSEKAFSPMLSTLEGSSSRLSAEWLKAKLPMVRTLLGKSISLKSEPENALLAISLTPAGTLYFFTVSLSKVRPRGIAMSLVPSPLNSTLAIIL